MCDALAFHLSNNGISCAGLNNKLRTSVLDDWISAKIQVVVATVAFGMGIERKDVRIVCHFNIPKSMVPFYQESAIYIIMRKAKSCRMCRQKSRLMNSIRWLSLVKHSVVVGKRFLAVLVNRYQTPMCKKTCDACKDPYLVKNLEELKEGISVHHS